jgi:hypothetical protein
VDSNDITAQVSGEQNIIFTVTGTPQFTRGIVFFTLTIHCTLILQKGFWDPDLGPKFGTPIVCASLYIKELVAPSIMSAFVK